MPKRIFWPAALVIMGLIFMATSMGYLPARFWNLWPVILVVVGLGGLLTSDREEWMSKRTVKATASKPAVRRKKASKRKRK